MTDGVLVLKEAIKLNWKYKLAGRKIIRDGRAAATHDMHATSFSTLVAPGYKLVWDQSSSAFTLLQESE